ncbi:MAG: hypothetical protein K8R64_01425 [Methanosarcinaceae archaeon]|nr:hypothetical protein [Methanosarcinaceae archaeon]
MSFTIASWNCPVVEYIQKNVDNSLYEYSSGPDDLYPGVARCAVASPHTLENMLDPYSAGIFKGDRVSFGCKRSRKHSGCPDHEVPVASALISLTGPYVDQQ